MVGVGGQGAAAALKIFVRHPKDSIDFVPRGQLEIFNDDLRQLLKRLLQHHPAHDFYSHTVTLMSPFEPLILNWDLLNSEARLESESDSGADKTARRALANVLDVLQKNTGDLQLNNYMSARESLVKTKTITFETLWTIFPPGTVVYGRPFLKQDQVFVVRDNVEAWPETTDKIWSLDCWTYDWDGNGFKRRAVRVVFERFNGSKPIESLPYHPLSENKRAAEIRETLIQRGKLYRKYCAMEHDTPRFKYEGKAIIDKKGLRFRSRPKNRRVRYIFPHNPRNRAFS